MGMPETAESGVMYEGYLQNLQLPVDFAIKGEMITTTLSIS